jgi:4-hydroxybenzoate polyprenyltransferase
LDTRIRYDICAPGLFLHPSFYFLSNAKSFSSDIFSSLTQDKLDDVTVGIRSTALLFGERTRPILSGLSTASVGLISYAGTLAGAGLPFFAGAGLAGAQLARVLYRTDFGDRASCWKGFVGCGWAGFWVWMGSVADYASAIM